ncbi:MAG: gliding motility-associated C-terminal domain-containing protein [Flavobacteriaceae bacterium]
MSLNSVTLFTLRFSGALGLDTDNDGTLDYHDLDSDSDGCPDALESMNNPYVEADLSAIGSIDTSVYPIDNLVGSPTYGVPNSVSFDVGTSQRDTIVANECQTALVINERNEVVVTEGEDASFTLKLEEAFDEDIALAITYTNISTTDQDYVPVSTLNLPANSTSVDLVVSTFDDTFIEPRESFQISISSLFPAITTPNTVATVNIVDNDALGDTGISFDTTDSIVDEDAGTIVLNVVLTGGVQGGFTVDFTSLDGTASEPEDYRAITGTLAFDGMDGEVGTISLPIIDDTVIEPTENLTIVLSNISTDLIGINEGNVTVTIIDNEVPIKPHRDYGEDMGIICGDMLPPVPQLRFSGGCGDLDVQFNEERTDIGESYDYWVIRTWTVTDICDTVEVFEQRIYVAQPDPIIVEMEACIHDGPVDLSPYLPEGVPGSGTFELWDGGGALDGSIYDSQNGPTGLHQLYYDVPHQNCMVSVLFEIDMHDRCLDSSCNIGRMVISKAVTVNGDGINDYFEIKGLEACGYTFQLKVFNRWGNIIYQSDKYDNTWDGRAPGNSMGTATKIPSGTYYYIITVPELDNEGKSGYIYIAGND